MSAALTGDCTIAVSIELARALARNFVAIVVSPFRQPVNCPAC
jgi:hypothetical protein